jgi:lysozyme
MTDRAKLRAQLMRHEGYRAKPYLDTVGVMTIGYGRNLRDVGITRDEADYLLNGDIDRTVKALLTHLPWMLELDSVRQAVLCNMAFNLGVSGLLTFRDTLKAVQQDRYDDAAEGMLASKWAQQVGQRAMELAVQMRSGQWE